MIEQVENAVSTIKMKSWETLPDIIADVIPPQKPGGGYNARTLSPDKAERVVLSITASLKELVAASQVPASSGFTTGVISSVVGAALAGTAFIQKISKPWRWTAGLGAGAAGIGAIVSFAGHRRDKEFTAQLNEIGAFLSKIEQDVSVRSELVERLSQDIPHRVSEDGSISFHHVLLGNMILNIGRDMGLIQQSNNIDALSLNLLQDDEKKLMDLSGFTRPANMPQSR